MKQYKRKINQWRHGFSTKNSDSTYIPLVSPHGIGIAFIVFPEPRSGKEHTKVEFVFNGILYARTWWHAMEKREVKQATRQLIDDVVQGRWQ